MTIMPVEIVRPEKSFVVILTEFICRSLGLLVAGAMVMWFAPLTFLHLHPGYWESAFTVVVTRILFTDPADFFQWTRSR